MIEDDSWLLVIYYDHGLLKVTKAMTMIDDDRWQHAVKDGCGWGDDMLWYILVGGEML